jgi:hypothetical protein
MNKMNEKMNEKKVLKNQLKGNFDDAHFCIRAFLTTKNIYIMNNNIKDK